MTLALLLCAFDGTQRQYLDIDTQAGLKQAQRQGPHADHLQCLYILCLCLGVEVDATWSNDFVTLPAGL